MTQEGKAAMCKPNEASVYGTKSKVCEIPATTNNNTAASP
jgi:hypothetical protein